MPPIILSTAVFYGLSGALALAGLLALALLPGPPVAAICSKEEVQLAGIRDPPRASTSHNAMAP